MDTLTMFVVWIWAMAFLFWLCPRLLGGWIGDVVVAYRQVVDRQ